ncbi:MAG TPA: PilW family protein [Kofleriaceae bacterium]|nr:PilW family protein [Kofleriaceae bacterium]
MERHARDLDRLGLVERGRPEPRDHLSHDAEQLVSGRSQPALGVLPRVLAPALRAVRSARRSAPRRCPSSRRHSRAQAGFTLIEMMIAVVLVSIVIGFALQVGLTFVNAARAAREAQGAERGARTSIEYLSDVVRAASTGSPTADVRDATNCTVAPSVAVENHADQPDKLTVVYGSGGVITSLRSTFDGNSSSFDVQDATGLQPGDGVIITDGSMGRLVPVKTMSATTGPATITTTSVSSACSGVSMPGSGFASGSIVVRGRAARFYVANATDGTPMLWMDPDADGPAPAEPLAEGIEDMQIAVGIDLNGDGVITDGASDADEWFYNAPGDAAPPDPTVTKWTAIRISLVARTTTDKGTQPQSQRPALEDRPAGSMDIYRRRVLASVIEIRNLETNP